MRIIDKYGNDLERHDGIWQSCLYDHWSVQFTEEEKPEQVWLVRKGAKLHLVTEDDGVTWSLQTKGVKPSVGTLELFGKRGIDIWHERIKVEPSALGPEEFNAMARQVAELALDLASMSHAPQVVSTGPKGDRAIGTSVSQQWRYNSSEFEYVRSICKSLLDHWHLITSNPATVIQRKVTLVPIERSTAPVALISRLTNPIRRRISGLGSVQSFNTVENRWLFYLLKEYLPERIQSVHRLASIVPLTYSDLQRKQYEDRSNKSTRELDILMHSIERCVSSSFLEAVDKVHRFPDPTRKLVDRQGYGEVYSSVFKGVYKLAQIEKLERLGSIYRTVCDAGIREMSNLYELWCLFAIYNAFRTRLQMEPKGIGPHDELEIVGDRLEIPKSAKRIYELIKQLPDKSVLKIKLGYEQHLRTKDGSYVSPDLLISIKAPEIGLVRDKTLFILDSKYHEYDELGGVLRRSSSSTGYCLRDDIEKVALKKYTNRPVESVAGSFILHPCDPMRYEWLGEKPYHQWIGVEPEDVPDSNILQFPGHRIGALSLRPDSINEKNKRFEKAISRLMTVILHYHVGLTNLCLHCGHVLTSTSEFGQNTCYDPLDRETTKLKPIDGEFQPLKLTSTFRARCSSCNNEWSVSFCNKRTDQHDNRPSFINRIIRPGYIQDSQWYGIHVVNNETHGATCPRCNQAFDGQSRYSSPPSNTPNEIQYDPFLED